MLIFVFQYFSDFQSIRKDDVQERSIVDENRKDFHLYRTGISNFVFYSYVSLGCKYDYLSWYQSRLEDSLTTWGVHETDFQNINFYNFGWINHVTIQIKIISVSREIATLDLHDSSNFEITTFLCKCVLRQLSIRWKENVSSFYQSTTDIRDNVRTIRVHVKGGNVIRKKEKY